jgi:hypothetical protein
MAMTRKAKVKDKCCICGQPAVAVWPVIDPDIETHPYCRKCLDEQKLKLLMEMEELDWNLDDEDE